MIRYIPPFILEKASRKEYRGSFNGFILILDIVDFTHIAEGFQQGGLHGADSIGNLLNQISRGLIEPINRYGGFVGLFIGDAICAIFPEADPSCLLAALGDIRRYLSSFCAILPDLGNSNISMREAISYGRIDWAIYPGELQHEYLFFGKPLLEASTMSHQERYLTVSPQALKKIGKSRIQRGTDDIQLICPIDPKPVKPLKFEYDPDIAWRFIHKRYHKETHINEIRNVAVCFIGLSAEKDPMQELDTLHYYADRYRGFVNKIDYANGCPVAIVLFGIPKSLGKSVYQACEFALAMISTDNTLTIGLSCGHAFAGYIGSGATHEYTALGNCMNIAARLQGNAEPGKIICDASIIKEVSTLYQLKALGTINLKGIDIDLPYFQLTSRNENKLIQFRHSFVGRETELEYLDYIARNAISHKRNSILYVNGDPGLGKSRLVWQYLRNQKDIHLLVSVSSLYNQNPLSAIIQVLQNFFGIAAESSNKEILARLRTVFQEKGWEENKPTRFMYLLGMILGVVSSNASLTHVATDYTREMVKNAITAFMSKLLDEKPVIWILDDGQWLDSETTLFLQDFEPRCEHPLILMSPCRLSPDGSLADLKLKHFTRYDLNLAPMKTEDQMNLLYKILNVNNDRNNTLASIVQKSGGYPLYLEQMAYYLLEKCKNTCDNQLLNPSREICIFSISDIFNSRLDGFSQEMRECVYHAAILGFQFDVKLLELILKKNIRQNLITGVNHRLWVATNQNRYFFTHALIRDMVYERLLHENLRELHKRTADALLEFYGDAFTAHTSEIAYHFEKADCLPEAAVHYFGASRFHMKMSNWQTGLIMQKKATLLSGIHYGFGSAEHIENLFWMAIDFHYIQHFAKAEHLYNIVFNNRMEALGEDDPMMSPYLNNLGRFYKDTARYTEAELLLRKSLCIEENFNPGSTNVADRLNNLASLFSKQGNWRKALAYSRKALSIFESCTHYERDFFVGLLFMNIGYLYLNLGDYQKAEIHAKRALNLFQNECGATNPRLAGTHHLLGNIYCLQKKFAEAEKCLLTARGKYGRFFGTNSPDYAKTNLSLGDLYELMENHAKAIRYWKKGARALISQMPKNHPWYLDAINRLNR